jgi:hypothetical protein
MMAWKFGSALLNGFLMDKNGRSRYEGLEYSTVGFVCKAVFSCYF